MIGLLANQFGRILIMISVGFFLARRKIISAEMKRQLSAFLTKVVLPVNIISSAGHTFTREGASGMLQVLVISVAYYLVAFLIVTKLAKKRELDENVKSVFINTAVFANVGFIGFPLLGELFGQAGTLYTTAYNSSYQLFFFSYGCFLLDGEGRLSLKNLFKNSAIYISAGSMLLYFSGIRFPDFIQSSLSSMGGIMVPLSMIIIGWEIASTKMQEVLFDRVSYLVSALRLLVFPALLAGVLYLLQIRGEVAIAAILLTALPAGSLTVILADDYGRDPRFGAKAVAQSTLFMLATLPLVFMAASYLFN